jgi:hypothetical protein
MVAHSDNSVGKFRYFPSQLNDLYNVQWEDKCAGEIGNTWNHLCYHDQ